MLQLSIMKPTAIKKGGKNKHDQCQNTVTQIKTINLTICMRLGTQWMMMFLNDE